MVLTPFTGGSRVSRVRGQWDLSRHYPPVERLLWRTGSLPPKSVRSEVAQAEPKSCSPCDDHHPPVDQHRCGAGSEAMRVMEQMSVARIKMAMCIVVELVQNQCASRSNKMAMCHERRRDQDGDVPWPQSEVDQSERKEKISICRNRR